MDTLDVQGHEKLDSQDKNRVPLSRLNQEIEKRKASEAQLKELADQLTEEVEESKRAIIPELPAGAKISWLRTAFKMGFFNDKETPRLAGQWPDYLYNQLRDLHDFGFVGMQPAKMRQRVQKLSEEEIQALSHFYASQK